MIMINRTGMARIFAVFILALLLLECPLVLAAAGSGSVVVTGTPVLTRAPATWSEARPTTTQTETKAQDVNIVVKDQPAITRAPATWSEAKKTTTTTTVTKKVERQLWTGTVSKAPEPRVSEPAPCTLQCGQCKQPSADCTVCVDAPVQCCGNGKCDAGETCTQDGCCAGTAKNFLADNNNCGACGTACSAGQSCKSGVCIPEAPSGNGLPEPEKPAEKSVDVAPGFTRAPAKWSDAKPTTSATVPDANVVVADQPTITKLPTSWEQAKKTTTTTTVVKTVTDIKKTPWGADWMVKTVTSPTSAGSTMTGSKTGESPSNSVPTRSTDWPTGGGGGTVIILSNTAPSISSASIISAPSPAREGSVLTAVPGSWSDDSTTTSAAQFNYQWSRNGAAIVGATAVTLTDTYFAKGDSVTVSITPVDHEGLKGTVKTSAATVIQNTAPGIVFAASPVTAAAGSTITYTAAGSDADPADTSSLSYSFDFDADGVYETPDADGVVSRTYADAGTYTVGARVSDGTDFSPASSVTVTITAVPGANNPPSISLSSDKLSAVVGETITYTAAGTDPDAGTVLQYRFDWTNDGTWDTTYSTNNVQTHSFATVGTHTTKVEVTDGAATAQATITVTVSPTNTPPTVTLSADKVSASLSEVVTFTATGTDPDAGTVLQYRFDWEGDGTWDTAYSTANVQAHSYSTAGLYTARAEVTDSIATAQATVTVTVSAANTAPTVALSADKSSAAVNEMITYTAVGTDPDAGTTLQYRFDWTNDGTWDTTYSTANAQAHSFAVAGTYTTRVEASDGTATSQATATVTVSAAGTGSGSTTVSSASSSSGGGGGGWSDEGSSSFKVSRSSKVSESYDSVVRDSRAYSKESIMNDIAGSEDLKNAIMQSLGIDRLTPEIVESIAESTAMVSKDLIVNRDLLSYVRYARSKLTVEYLGDLVLKNFIVYETVPKSFAESAKDVAVTATGAKVYVVKDDPMISFSYDVMTRNKVIEIEEVSGEYRTDKELAEFESPRILVIKAVVLGPDEMVLSSEFAGPGEEVTVRVKSSARVTAYLDGVLVSSASPDANGEAMFRVSASAPGLHEITAEYGEKKVSGMFVVRGTPGKIMVSGLTDDASRILAGEEGVVSLVLGESGDYEAEVSGVPAGWLNYQKKLSVGAIGFDSAEESRTLAIKVFGGAAGANTMRITLRKDGKPYAQIDINVVVMPVAEEGAAGAAGAVSGPLGFVLAAGAGGAWSIVITLAILVGLGIRSARNYRDKGMFRPFIRE